MNSLRATRATRIFRNFQILSVRMRRTQFAKIINNEIPWRCPRVRGGGVLIKAKRLRTSYEDLYIRSFLITLKIKIFLY